MTDAPLSILLFAAGLGTRMAPLTDSRPKPLIEVAGRTLLDHALDLCGGLRVVVNSHYLADQIAEHLHGSDVLISHETDRPLETGGGLKRALPLLTSNPVFTLNTDAVWQGADPVDVLSRRWELGMEALLLLIPRRNATGHVGSGDFDLDETGRIVRGTDFVYSGLQIIRTDRLKEIPAEAFSMWALWTGMIERRTMFGYVYGVRWCDVGRPESIEIAEEMLAGPVDV